MKPEPWDKCQGKIHTFFGNCDRKPSVVRDGTPYCWQHDPERRRQIGLERRAADRAYEVELVRQWAREDLESAAGLRPSQIAKLTDDDLRMLADAGGVLAFLPTRETK